MIFVDGRKNTMWECLRKIVNEAKVNVKDIFV